MRSRFQTPKRPRFDPQGHVIEYAPRFKKRVEKVLQNPCVLCHERPGRFFAPAGLACGECTRNRKAQEVA